VTLDAGVHHVGTEAIHSVPPLIVLVAGAVLSSDALLGFAAGMFSVLLASNMRCRAPFYRWRVDDPGAREGDR